VRSPYLHHLNKSSLKQILQQEVY